MIRLVSNRLFCGRCAWTLRIASRQAASASSTRGQRDQPAVGLAQRGQVADLAHRDEPLVGRVAPARRLEQVDLLVRGRQPGEVELAQPLQLQPLAICGCRPRISRSSAKPVAVGPEGEVVVHHGAAGAGDGRGDPADAARAAGARRGARRARAAIASASGWSSQAT